MNTVTTIDTNNFAEMAQAMGMGADAPKTSKSGSMLIKYLYAPSYNASCIRSS
jgi:hypothetical protein